MFVMQCNDTELHRKHVWTKSWRKIQLPFLRRKELYPDSWNADYICRGVYAVTESVEEETRRAYKGGLTYNV